MNEPTWLLEYRRDVYSQTGEDGVIEKILEVLPDHDGWCVEFGAWDGVQSSNTRHLICHKGYSAVLIEATTSRFRDLQANYAAHGEKVITLNRWVGFSQDDHLDDILSETPIPPDFDLLSIDIDGNDYHVWKRTSRYRPKVVVIEFNHTIPTEVRFIQEADPEINQGASLLSIVELAVEKGYELVSVLRFNAFFVRKEYFPLFHLSSNAPHLLRTDLSRITYLFSGYDGKIFLQGYGCLPWHGFALKETAVQVLPRYLRRYPGRYSRPRKFIFYFFLLLRYPKRFATELGRRATALRLKRTAITDVKLG